MFLVVGITGKAGGATATHLLAQGKKVRALVRDRAKAASWADQGVELVDGDWNNAAAIEPVQAECVNDECEGGDGVRGSRIARAAH